MVIDFALLEDVAPMKYHMSRIYLV